MLPILTPAPEQVTELQRQGRAIVLPLRLVPHSVVVQAALLQQFGVVAGLDDAPLFQHKNGLRMQDGREPVRDRDRDARALRGQTLHGVGDLLFGQLAGAQHMLKDQPQQRKQNGQLEQTQRRALQKRQQTDAFDLFRSTERAPSCTELTILMIVRDVTRNQC